MTGGGESGRGYPIHINIYFPEPYPCMNLRLVGFVILVSCTCIIGTTLAEVPDMVGNWTGTCEGYMGDTGFVDYPLGSFSLNITEQKNLVFAGFFLTKDKAGAAIKKPTAGVLNTEGTGFYLAEEKQGFSYGEIIGPDEMRLTYIDSTEPVFAGIDHLVRAS
jgi:hypothetical protein